MEEDPEEPNELEMVLKKMHKKYLSRIQPKNGGGGGGCCSTKKNYKINTNFINHIHNTKCSVLSF